MQDLVSLSPRASETGKATKETWPQLPFLCHFVLVARRKVGSHDVI